MTEINENRINFSEIDFSAFQEKIVPLSKENTSLLVNRGACLTRYKGSLFAEFPPFLQPIHMASAYKGVCHADKKGRQAKELYKNRRETRFRRRNRFERASERM